uniref:Uncharacterized protein n=1 Tax=Rhizophora mucronata TaxID=61149 RepID=A0A2P2NAQ7_RHIMU
MELNKILYKVLIIKV